MSDSLPTLSSTCTFADGYPKAQQINCNDDASVDGIEETVTAGRAA